MIHPDWGIGIDAVDLEQRTKNPTFLKRMIQEKTKLENLSEELRVLYVGMTRAKEKKSRIAGKQMKKIRLHCIRWKGQRPALTGSYRH